MKVKRPLPSCKNCSGLGFTLGRWICAVRDMQPINRRHARSVARRCPAYRWWGSELGAFLKHRKEQP